MRLPRSCGLTALALLIQITNGHAAPAPNVLMANPESTAFADEEYIAFAVAGVDDSCTLVWTFTDTIATPPTQGTATAGQAALPYGDQCPGQVFPTAVANYKWTGSDTKILQDSFVVNVQYPTDVRPITVMVKRAGLVVKSIDLAAGTAILDLNGASDTSGKITFEFVDSAGGTSTQTTTTVYGPGTGRGITIERPKIVKGKYTKVNIKWDTTTHRSDGTSPKHTLEATFTPPKPWDVLGIIRYSQYNVTTESDCTGDAVEKWYVESMDLCEFEKANFKSDFLSQADLNGTGNSTDHGYVKPGKITRLAKACAGKFPDGATKFNTYVHVSSVTGSCNKVLVAGVSVATNPENCKAEETLVNRTNNKTFGTKKAQDTCPACNRDFEGTDGHIDSLTSVAKCNPHDFADLGNYWTLQRP